VQTGVYLIGLRHPATVARQLATIAEMAPGRFTFGVGVGGDDPRELELCGVDPRTRGAQASEAIELVKAFVTGKEVTFDGRFFTVDRGAIRPAPNPAIPMLVGGRSNAALAQRGPLRRRVARAVGVASPLRGGSQTGARRCRCRWPRWRGVAARPPAMDGT
jgi:alkanesulfonate monooxygenase SsuD/methylene tetrahydromethanopterin reductase-like flavin-dependent oxidoreductase (luciferase family)